jgi:hypothetical protein
VARMALARQSWPAQVHQGIGLATRRTKGGGVIARSRGDPGWVAAACAREGSPHATSEALACAGVASAAQGLMSFRYYEERSMETPSGMPSGDVPPATPISAQRTEGEGKEPTHVHEDVTHSHDHYHVTHHHRGGVAGLGEWEHQTSWHTHEHNHGQLTHSHDYGEEEERQRHGKEAHDHDHSHPTE